MNTMLAGLVTYEASQGLGLPDAYGFACVAAGIFFTGLALGLLFQQQKSDSAILAEVRVRSDD